ncbi:MAG: hypothetical protein P8P40_04445 [Sulfitobacter sp.]|nr:hypothetical protein [Sulfitobacter sp.]MDG1354294.1 hypothetical protein [Sulfitobacter sp.]
MITWTSKPLAALGIVTMLGACDAAGTGSALLAGLAPPTDAALPIVPLRQALMMRGKVTLVPPSGYCIDPESLSENFALMARCDALGAPTGGSGAPVGVLSVSFTRGGKGTPVPTAQEITTASGLGQPQSISRHGQSVVFKTTGKPPAPDLSPYHWRSISRVGGYTMGAALYGPQDRRAVSDEGADLLREMIQRTTGKTKAG